MPNTLTDPERKRLVDFLLREADDATLLDAVSDTVAQHTRSKSEFKRLNVQLGIPPVASAGAQGSATPAPTPTKAQQEAPPIAPAEATNQEPPGEACTRIGSDTKVAILGILRRGPANANKINAGINGKAGNTQKLLKLLWTRNLVTYDGEKFDLVQ